MPTKVIIFDFFGVLSSDVYSQWYDTHAITIGKKEVGNKYTRPADLGDITDDELFVGIANLNAENPSEVRDEWLELASINTELVAFITELRKHYTIALCSNASSPFLRDLLKKNNLESLFDVIVISSDVHLAKPDHAIFKLVLDRLGVKPEEAVFTDDSTANVASASALGITSLLFSTTEQFKTDLKTHGIG
jgi:putative hydrolase of the HAD superfamily